MPVEPTIGPDEALLRDLEAFGRTLQAETDGDITSNGLRDVEILPGIEATLPPMTDSGDQAVRTPPSVRRAIPTLAAAAVVIAIGAAVLLAILGDEPATEPSADDPVATTVDEERDSRTDADDPGGDDAAKGVFPIVGPSVITAVDGTPIGGIEIDPADDEPTMTFTDGGGFDRPYLQLAIGELLADRELLTELGWRSDLVDDRTGRAMTAQRWLAQSGLTITTHLDTTLSGLAAQSIAANLDPETDFDATVITVDPSTGGIAVFTTTADTVYWTSTLSDSNRGGSVTASGPLDDDARPCCRIEPGSAFKPIVLAAALEDGASPSDLIRGDGPCVFETGPDKGDTYTVGGADRGTMSLAAATRASNNCAYVRLGLSVGTEATLAVAASLGLTDLPTDVDGPYAALPLGTWAVDPIELTSAYATFANDGRLVKPRFLHEVTMADGTAVRFHDRTGAVGQQTIGIDTARRITEVLTSTVENGTGTNARLDGRQVAGKTGTTNDFTSAWFVGYTPTWTTTVWLGDSERLQPVVLPGYGTVFGGEVPAVIWHDFMESAHAELTAETFPEPAPLEREPLMIEVAEDVTGDR